MEIVIGIYLLVVILACFVVPSLMSSTTKFGTNGHLSSEFKVTLFMLLNMVVSLVIISRTDGDNSLGGVLVAVFLIIGATIVSSVYVLGRSLIKIRKGS